MANVVTAAAIVVSVGGADRYLYRGAAVPSGVKAEEIKRLRSIGLIGEVKAKPAPAAPEKSDGNPEDPEGAGGQEPEDPEGAGGQEPEKPKSTGSSAAKSTGK